MAEAGFEPRSKKSLHVHDMHGMDSPSDLQSLIGYDEDDDSTIVGIRGFDRGPFDDDDEISLWPQAHPGRPSNDFRNPFFHKTYGSSSGSSGSGLDLKPIPNVPLLTANLFGRTARDAFLELDIPMKIKPIPTSLLLETMPVSVTSATNILVAEIRPPGEPEDESLSRKLGKGLRLVPPSPLEDLNTSSSDCPLPSTLSSEQLKEPTLSTPYADPPLPSISPPEGISVTDTGETHASTIEERSPTASSIASDKQSCLRYEAGRPVTDEADNVRLSDRIQPQEVPSRMGRFVIDKGNPKPFLCRKPWCKRSFSRASDAERHFKTAAIHNPRGSRKDTSTRCRKCGEELSRPDARKRHEERGACGKRRITRKPLGPYPMASA